MSQKTPIIYLLRHGETEWSLTGQHTGITDIPLTENGKKEAKSIAKVVSGIHFIKALSSPLSRAIETAKLAHLNCPIELRPNLIEWNYGDYEGLKTNEIIAKNPGWNLFDQGAPGGETKEMVAKRADLIIQEIHTFNDNVAIISHGHFLRIFAARWVQQAPHFGKHLYLNTASISILGYEHNNLNEPIIKSWNLIPRL